MLRPQCGTAFGASTRPSLRPSDPIDALLSNADDAYSTVLNQYGDDILNSTAAHFGLAQIYFDEGKFAEALREVDAALTLAPENQNVHYLRGRILTRLGRSDDAKAELAATQKLMNQSLGKARGDLGDKEIPNPELTREPN